jgi:hypothetical protein
VPGYTTTFEAAPLDRTAQLVTKGIWLLAIGLLAGGAGVAVFGSSSAGLVTLVVGALFALTVAWMRRVEPRAYDVGEGALQVRRRSAAASTFSGPIAHVRRGALGLRVWGDGGGYGYLGRYRAGGRTVRAFVTDRRNVVLLEVGGDALALSPRDPDDFIAEVGRGA